MLWFQEHRWLVHHPGTRFTAYVPSHVSRREDVHWTLEAQWIAGGAAWRRVMAHQRPSLEIQLSGWRLPGASWQSLGEVDFWTEKEEKKKSPLMAFLESRAGWIDVDYRPRPYPAPPVSNQMGLCQWRVAKREGFRFTVELACAPHGRGVWPPQEGPEVRVLPDGTEERVERGPEFWKEHASLYMLEDIPFGELRVLVPRNVRDPEAYAVRRARDLFGTPEPENAKVLDFTRKTEQPGSLGDEIHVELQFHGYYEE